MKQLVLAATVFLATFAPVVVNAHSLPVDASEKMAAVLLDLRPGWCKLFPWWCK